MKKLFFSLIILSMMSLFCCRFGKKQTPSFTGLHGQLSVQGTQLTDCHGNPIILRGVSYGWHNWWPQYWNRDVVLWLRDDWKCTVIRAAMGIEPDGGYLQDPETSKTLMKTVVEACIEAGVYVIIDWHDHHATRNRDQAKAFFIEMAKTYGRYPNVIYEIYNEPVHEEWSVVKVYSDTIITAIRQYDPDNIILVGTPHWDQDVHIAADDPLTGHDNIMLTLHFYAKTHLQWLRDRGDYALNKGIPLFVSEMDGSNSSGQGGIDMEEWKRWIDWMETNGISWVKWSIADKEESCAALKPGASSQGGWPVESLTESGVQARAMIRELNGEGGIK